MRKRKRKYKSESLGKVKIIEDFLPQPEDLVLKQETTKVTMALTKSSVDFFRDEAKKHHVSYQVMIRELVDQYAARFS